MKTANLSYLLILLAIIVLGACESKEASKNQNEKLRIAISKASGSESYEHYVKWLKSVNPNIEIVDLINHPADSISQILSSCHALLLSGGNDINPDYYGMKERQNECGTIDYERDTIEYAALQYAFNAKMPILGICRGQQIINVYLGGNLLVDIQTDRPSIVKHQCDEIVECKHAITILPNNILAEILESNEQVIVNTSHHQAIDIPALNIQALANAEDGIIEAIGWMDTQNRSFLLGVQFHPERMDFQEVASKNIAKRFLDEAINYQNTKQ